MIRAYQEKECEDCNEDLYNMIDDFDEFVDDAICSDGRGYFLARYDSDEHEIKLDNEYYFIYRTN